MHAYLSLKAVYTLCLLLTDMHIQGTHHTIELFCYNTDVAMCWISDPFFFSGITDWRVSFHLLLSIHNTIISFSFFSFSSSPLSFPQMTPSESRSLNKPCVVMSFYDSHDVWHFLSAGALFLAFMVSWLLYNACVYVLHTQCMLLSQTLFLSFLVYVDPR